MLEPKLRTYPCSSVRTQGVFLRSERLSHKRLLLANGTQTRARLTLHSAFETCGEMAARHKHTTDVLVEANLAFGICLLPLLGLDLILLLFNWIALEVQLERLHAIMDGLGDTVSAPSRKTRKSAANKDEVGGPDYFKVVVGF